METTFITIHDLSLDARIRYASDSVEDILGYQPHEVVKKSCWEYFHPDEIPFARAIHGKGIQLDKAAVLNYCQIKHKNGFWVGCECVFTIVYDVLVASTSIYRRDSKSEQRALNAPVIRRLFSSSPRDPRYHMLSYISSKFSTIPKPRSHETRAALFLNRFTRTSTIMFATNGVTDILGIRPELLISKSFYMCIAENCLQEAVRCLESAKANDSIAYLRFWFRNPLHEEQANQDVQMDDTRSSEDEDEGGVHLNGHRVEEASDEAMQTDSPHAQSGSEARTSEVSTEQETSDNVREDKSRSSSGNSTDLDGNANENIFDRPSHGSSASSRTLGTPDEERQRNLHPQQQQRQIEVEAVVSCTSDGLIVIMRRARPIIPQNLQQSAPPAYTNGFFASPWAINPIMPSQPPPQYNDYGFHPPAATEQFAQAAAPGPDSQDFMSTIRDVAVFAWSLTGINGSLVQYGRGKPVGESTPPGGVPVWDPKSNADPENRFNGFADNINRRISEPYINSGSNSSGSDEEIVWRRAETMPTWQPIPRRGHGGAAFLTRSENSTDVDEEDPEALRQMRWL